MRASLTALFVGAATLALELVAARVANLNVGISLYSWTGVIGGTLAGLAVGGAAGAAVADRGDDGLRRRRLGWLLAAAALYAPVAVTLTSTPAFVAALGALGRSGQLAVVVVLAALAPALLLGAAGPLLARLAVNRLATGGRAVGRLGAASALGSLIGALAAGLALIPTVGVRGTALVAALVLAIAIALPPGREHRSSPGGASASPARREHWLLATLLGLLALAAPFVPHACEVESAYQCLRVDDDQMTDGHPIRVLYLDGLPHAHVALDDPLLLPHDYLVPAAELAAYQAASSVLVIGGGGYSLPRYLAAAHPGIAIDVLELDPAVTAIARLRLGLPASPPFTIVHGDARLTLPSLPADRRYDLAILDAFADVVVPYHLVTTELDGQVRARLAADGRYVALVHDRADVGRLLPAVARTMRAVFGQVDVLAAGPGVPWERPGPRTWSVVGGRARVDPDRLRATRRQTASGAFPALSEAMPPDRLADLLDRAGPETLTDDHAPVEVLAAPLFQ